MADLPKLTSQDREHLRNIGFGSLPDNPAQARYSAKEIKGASTRPNLQLFDWLKGTREYLASDGVIHKVDELTEASDYEEGSILLYNDGDNLKFYVVDANHQAQPIGLDSTSELQVVNDVKIDGNSVVNEGIVSVSLSDGLTYTNGSLGLSLTDGLTVKSGSVGLTLSNLPEVVPKNLTLSQQNELSILAEHNGVISRVQAGQLDYSRLKVVSNEEDGLQRIANEDFLFIKEN